MLILLLLVLVPERVAFCGPFAPAAGEEETTAISMDNAEIVAWATSWTDLVYGERVTDSYKTPDKALGPATGSNTDIVSLGCGGMITLGFDSSIRNGVGWDFVVFENSFSDTFLELALVEVSSNGRDFVRFDHYSLTEASVSEFGTIDPTDIKGFAGKYRIGFGTPFDLSDLALKSEVLNGTLDLSSISHIRIIDVSGEGDVQDSHGNPIYDPYPTNISAGFDLEAVGVRYEAAESFSNQPEQPRLNSPQNNSVDIGLTPLLQVESFSDADTNDLHLLTKWELSSSSSFGAESLKMKLYSGQNLTNLRIPSLLLDKEETVYWRVQFLDTAGNSSAWSESFQFTTTGFDVETPIVEYDWDGDGVSDTGISTFISTGTDDIEVYIGIAPGTNVNRIERIVDLDSVEFNDQLDDSPVEFPLGVFGLKLVPEDSDNRLLFTVYFSEAAPDNAFWHTYDPIYGWQEDIRAYFNADRNRLYLSVEDGSADIGDGDGMKNGVVIYTGGLATRESRSSESGTEGIGSKGGCFISTIQSTLALKQFFLLATIALFSIVWSVAVDWMGKKKST